MGAKGSDPWNENEEQIDTREEMRTPREQVECKVKNITSGKYRKIGHIRRLLRYKNKDDWETELSCWSLDHAKLKAERGAASSAFKGRKKWNKSLNWEKAMGAELWFVYFQRLNGAFWNMH